MDKILIIEDEKNVIEVVKAYLENAGFEVLSAMKGKEGLDIFKIDSPDLIILDLMLPDTTGEDICKEVRKYSTTPIIMLTAKSDVENRIYGLSVGADDYLIKPFSPKELIMRVKAVLRRSNLVKPSSDTLTSNLDLKIDTLQHKVYKKGKEIYLTPVEYKLLLILSNNPNKVYTREDLIDKIFGLDFEGFDRTIDAHVKNLRKKVEDSPKDPKYIKTIFGVGYKYEGDGK